VRLLARGTPWFVPALWVAPVLARRAAVRSGLVLLATGCTWFFRDPERTPGGPGFLAAADGVVRSVARRQDGAWVVSTYLDLRDVHVTRAPCEGTVLAQTRHSGGNHAAWSPDSDHNHRLAWTLSTEWGEVGLTQYAGLVARRIVAHCGPGSRVSRGERIGLIRFGSRVDVVLPPGSTPSVVAGRRLRAGESVIASLPDPR
jgi:phosphatidylserine decarboxylase